MRKFIAIILALSTLIPAFAQNTRKVNGVVRDENSDVLPGAIVVVKKGAADGPVAATATTDNSGHYISTPSLIRLSTPTVSPLPSSATCMS